MEDNEAVSYSVLLKELGLMKSKKGRQKWWRNLTNEEKAMYIETVQKRKAVKRRNKSLLKMKKYGDKYKCSECFHRKTGSCTDDLPCGCEFWFNPNSEIIGLAYGEADARRDKKVRQRAGIHS